MIVGIDLGTTYSCLAYENQLGKVVLNTDFSWPEIELIPSRVLILEQTVYVGKSVNSLLEHNADQPAIQFFKRFLGQRKVLFIDHKGNEWFPEMIAALVLKKLLNDFKRNLLKNVTGIVITVPAHFGSLQRKAVIDAAYLAEVPLLGLVEEPVAAAIHYRSLQKKDDRIFLIYDLGGGTFDASVVTYNQSGFYVLSKEGITDLGGKEFDNEIAKMILYRFEREFDFRAEKLTPASMLQLSKYAEVIKIELCSSTSSLLRKSVTLADHTLEILFDRNAFENAIAPLVDRTISSVKEVLKGAGLNFVDIDEVILVGGTSKTPLISQKLRKLLPAECQLVTLHQPMKAVAYGALAYAKDLAAEVSTNQSKKVFRNVAGFNLGIKIYDHSTNEARIDSLILKNSVLPATAHREYFKSFPNQKFLEIELVEFLQSSAASESLGKVEIGPLAGSNNEGILVEVVFQENGIIKVKAFDVANGTEVLQTIAYNVELNMLEKWKAVVTGLSFT